MHPVLVRALAGLRSRRGAVLALVLVVGASLAVVLTAASGSRRGMSALERFTTFNQPGSLQAYVDPTLPVDQQLDLLAQLDAAAGPSRAGRSANVIVAVPGPSGVVDPATFLVVATAALDDEALRVVDRPLVLAGALPLAPGEVAINEAFARRRGVAVGDELELAVFAPDQTEAVAGGAMPPPAQEVTVTVGAVVRRPKDLAHSPQAQPGTVFEADEVSLSLEPSFFDRLDGAVAGYGMGLAAVPDDPRATAERLRSVGGDHTFVALGRTEDLQVIDPVGDAIDLESRALLAFGAVVAVAAFVLLGPALQRVVGEDPEERFVLQAMGFTRRQTAAIRALRAGAVAVAATAVGVALAIPLSVLTPIGLARDAEVGRGVSVDGFVLAVGGAVAVVVLLVRAVVGADGTRTRRRDAGALVEGRGRSRSWLAGAPPAVALGADLALEAAGGRTRSAPRATIVAAAVGVVAVVGAVTFAASLDHLVGDPELAGWRWDLVVGNYSQETSAAEGASALERSPVVAAYSGYQTARMDVDGVQVNVAGFEQDEGEPLAPVVLEGRAARGPGEIAMGRGTLRALGKSIGDDVVVTGEGEPSTVHIVGEVVAPAVLDYGMDLDSGAAMTLDGLERALKSQLVVAPVAYLVRLAPGVDPADARQQLRADFPGSILGPMVPLDVRDLERVRGLPFLLAGLLGAMAVGSVGVMLAAVASRRRRDLAVLRSLGFERRHVRSLLAAQTTTFVLLALAVGVPLGVVVGRQAWRLAAGGIGSEVPPLVPAGLIAAAAVGVLVLANLAGRAVSGGISRRPIAGALHVE